ncbi:MAG: hypothetical protein PVH37_15955 [Desulfobacterales bacterium]
MNKPSVLIMADKFAEVSKKTIDILINDGMRVQEHGYNTAGPNSSGLKFMLTARLR